MTDWDEQNGQPSGCDDCPGKVSAMLAQSGVTGGPVMFLAPDERLRQHLVRALAEHLRWCRRSAIAVPPELAELLATLAARDGQQRPKSTVVDSVADPVCVDYETAGRMLGGVSARTLRRMVADGRLVAVRIGRRALIRRQDIERLGRSDDVA